VESREFRELGLAHLALFLRHHENFKIGAEKKEDAPIEHHILDGGLDPIEQNFIFLAILDAVRAVDFLRLQKMIDSSRIGIIGRGLGGVAAAFAAVFKKNNVRALVIENMSYVWYPRWLEESTSAGRMELAEILGSATVQKNRTRLKKSLEYIDPLFIAEDLTIPVMLSANLKESENPPVPAFAFFNHLKTEKIAQIYPELNSDPSMSIQRSKSIEFMAEMLLQKAKS
jgi:cephalosporin-C deacetylase-like acetyl esterase